MVMIWYFSHIHLVQGPKSSARAGHENTFFAPADVNKAVLQGAYHLARKSGNFGLKSNGKVIFRKFHSEIVEYLQRYSSFSVRNGTAEISLPFAKLSSLSSPENNYGKSKCKW